MLAHRCFLHIRATYRQAPSEPPLLARGVYEDSTAFNRQAPNDAPQAKVQGHNKPPAFRNSAWRRSQVGRVRDPSRYITLQWCKIKMQQLPIIHLKFIQTNFRKSNTMSLAKAIHQYIATLNLSLLTMPYNKYN